MARRKCRHRPAVSCQGCGACKARRQESPYYNRPPFLLFNKSPPAQRLRTKLFSSLDVEEIGNLSALRFGLFSKAVGPTCIITARNQPPDPGGMLEYIVPKPSKSNDDEYRVAIEPRDVNVVHSGEARSDPLVWSAFSWGGRRDLALLHRLQRFQTLEKLESLGHVETREGIIRGDRQKRQTLILGKPMLERPNFPERTFLRLSPEQLEENKDPWTHSADSTDFTAFQTPQLILKQSPLLSKKRFQAALNTGKEGVLCTQSYLTIHAKQYKENVLQGACLSYNSKLAVYFMLLSSGRFAAYRQESLAEVCCVSRCRKPLITYSTVSSTWRMWTIASVRCSASIRPNGPWLRTCLTSHCRISKAGRIPLVGSELFASQHPADRQPNRTCSNTPRNSFVC